MIPVEWLTECALAQAATAVAAPQTGDPKLDALIALGWGALGIGGLSFADKIAFWVTKFRGRKNGNGDGSSTKLVHAAERLAEAVERLDVRVDKIHDICTRLEDRSRR